MKFLSLNEWPFWRLHILVFSSALSEVCDVGDEDIRDVIDIEDNLDDDEQGSESQGCFRMLSRIILRPVLTVRHFFTRSMASSLIFR